MRKLMLTERLAGQDVYTIACELFVKEDGTVVVGQVFGEMETFLTEAVNWAVEQIRAGQLVAYKQVDVQSWRTLEIQRDRAIAPIESKYSM